MVLAFRYNPAEWLMSNAKEKAGGSQIIKNPTYVTSNQEAGDRAKVYIWIQACIFRELLGINNPFWRVIWVST